MLKSRIPKIAAELRPRVEEAVKAGAEHVALAAKARVPVETGHLRESIHVESTPEGEYVVADARAYNNKTGEEEGMHYGRLVEFGSAHGPAQPFLIPALEESRKAIEGLAKSALRRTT